MFEASGQITTLGFSPHFSHENISQRKSVPFNSFDCSGEVIYKDTKLNSNSFVLKGEMKVNSNYAAVWGKLENPVVLFDKNFDIDITLVDHCEKLFCMAIKNVMMLDSASRVNNYKESNYTASRLNFRRIKSGLDSTTENTYGEIRKHLCEFFSFIRCYLSKLSSQRNFVSQIQQFVPDVFDQLLDLRRFLRSLKDLPNYVVAHSANSVGNKCQLASYHLFHMHLDLRWYCLTAIHQVMKCSHLIIIEDQYDENGNILEEQILLLLSDLIIIAIDRFERISLNSIKKSPFNCLCVKELWLMLQLYINKLHEEENGKSFWTYFDQLLDVVLTRTSGSDCSRNISSPPTIYNCSDPLCFSLWLLVHIAQLNGYLESGEFVGKTSERIESNYPQLESILKTCMSADSNVSEQQLKVIIIMVTTLTTEWWETRIEPVTILWEYFHRRLNCDFSVPGANVYSVAVMRKTSTGMLEQVKACISGSPHQDASIYDLFLSLLGRLMKLCMEQDQHNQWLRMKGRIYSKFTANKMQSLTDVGLYHVVTLFLTLAYTVNLQEVGNKLQDLLSLLPANSLDASRMRVCMKANIALILLYVEKGFDIADISRPLQMLLTGLCSQKDTSSLALMKTYVDGLQDIMKISQSFQLSEHHLIGGWIPLYLSNCSLHDSCHLLDVIISILTKVRQTINNIMVEELDHNRAMADILLQQVLPYIQSKYTNIFGQLPYQFADIAAGFSILVLKNPGIQGHTFEKLFMQFVSLDKVNVRFQTRYLCLILPEEGVIELMTDENSYVENTVIQAWVRCSLLSVNVTTSDLSDLTRIVSKLPAMQSLCLITDTSLEDADDALISFFRVLGASYKIIQDIHKKEEFRERCMTYLKRVEKSVESVINCATSSSELVSRIYLSAACLTYHCGTLLYIRSKPDCLIPRLVQILLLPHAVYKTEIRLHPHIATAMKTTLHHFILGIFRLNPKYDTFAGRVLRDIISQYMTRLVNKYATSPGVFINHPLHKCCIGNENLELCRFILETVSNKFICCKGNTRSSPEEHATLALLFIIDVITSKKDSKEVLHHIIDVSLPKMLELVMFIEPGENARKFTVELIRLITKSSVYGDESREKFVTVMLSVCEKHMAFYSSQVFKLCISMGELSQDLILNLLPKLQELVTAVEQRRGAVYDPRLRIGLTKVMSSVGAK